MNGPERPLREVIDALACETDGAELQAKLGPALLARVYSAYMPAWRSRTEVAELLTIPFAEVEQATVLLWCNSLLAKHTRASFFAAQTKAACVDFFRHAERARLDKPLLAVGDVYEEPRPMVPPPPSKTDLARQRADLQKQRQEAMAKRFSAAATDAKGDTWLVCGCGHVESESSAEPKAGPCLDCGRSWARAPEAETASGVGIAVRPEGLPCLVPASQDEPTGQDESPQGEAIPTEGSPSLSEPAPAPVWHPSHATRQNATPRRLTTKERCRAGVKGKRPPALVYTYCERCGYVEETPEAAAPCVAVAEDDVLGLDVTVRDGAEQEQDEQADLFSFDSFDDEPAGEPKEHDDHG